MANTSFTDLLGTLLNADLAPTTTDRLKQGLGAGGPASGSDLGNLLKSLGLDTSKLGDLLAGSAKIGDILGSGKLGDILGGAGGKLGDVLGGLFGGQGGEGIGQTLSGTLEEAQKAVGSNKKIALAALGALAGAILGGGSKSMRGAVGGGILAVPGSVGVPGSERDPARNAGGAFNAQGAGKCYRAGAIGKSGPAYAACHDQCSQGGRAH